MKNFAKAIIATAIAIGAIDTIGPAQAQVQSDRVAGRWYCQNSARGLTEKTKHLAVVTEMTIDAGSDGTFQAQQINRGSVYTYQVVGGGQWQLHQNTLTFAGQGQSSDPLRYGVAQPMVATGDFQDTNTIMSHHNDGNTVASFACRKIQ